MASAPDSGQRATTVARQAGDSSWIERTARILVMAAAVTFDPDKARGMDAAQRQVAAQP